MRARELGAFVGAGADDLTFVPNATTGVNIAARALDLQPGDEVLATNLEYGACDLTWEWLCERTGARYVRAEAGQLLEQRSERTRAVFLSHITSETALLLPVEEIVAQARAEGLVTIVDGAHAVAQVDARPIERSARTSTPATATSGCARRKAPAFCTRDPSGRTASTGRSSAGATRSR